jgi:hypothetical protein
LKRTTCGEAREIPPDTYPVYAQEWVDRNVVMISAAEAVAGRSSLAKISELTYDQQPTILRKTVEGQPAAELSRRISLKRRFYLLAVQIANVPDDWEHFAQAMAALR